MESSLKARTVILADVAVRLALVIGLTAVVLPVEYGYHRAWYREIASNCSGIECVIGLALFGLVVVSLAYTLWWFFSRLAFAIGYSTEQWFENSTEERTGRLRISGARPAERNTTSSGRSVGAVSSSWVRSGALFAAGSAVLGSFVYQSWAGYLPTSAYGWFGYGGGLASAFVCWVCGLYALSTSIECTGKSLEIRRCRRTTRTVDIENVRYVVIGHLARPWTFGPVQLNAEKADLGFKLEDGGVIPLFDVRVSTAGPTLELLQHHGVEVQIPDPDRRRLDGDEELLNYLRLDED